MLSATIDRYAYGTLRRARRRQIQRRVASTTACRSTSRRDEPLALRRQPRSRQGGHPPARRAATQGFDFFLHSNAPPGSGLGSSSTVDGRADRPAPGLPPPAADRLRDRRAGLRRSSASISASPAACRTSTPPPSAGSTSSSSTRDRVIVNPLRIHGDVILRARVQPAALLHRPTRGSRDHIIDDQTARFERRRGRTRSRACAMQKELTIEMKNALLRGAARPVRRAARRGVAGQEADVAAHLQPGASTSSTTQALRGGALGGKVTGAGGGGYMLFYCAFRQAPPRWPSALTEIGACVIDFAFEPDGIKTWKVDDL